MIVSCLKIIFKMCPVVSEDTLALPTQEVLNIIGSECIAQAVSDSDAIWFVVFERVIKEYERVGRTDLIDTFTWLDHHFRLDNQYKFNDLQVYHYVGGNADREPTCEESA